MLAPGTLIDRYELVCHIGDGGMAHVWAARQRGLHGFEKLVALKIIHSRYAEDPSFRRMFLDEARLVSSIQHRNVAQVFDLGETSSLLYLVMEYVEGDSLFSLIAPQNTVPIPIALRIAAEACAGLDAAHGLTDEHGRARNVVHRDVSPQNVLLGTNGDVKLIDFGIAHARDRSAAATSVDEVKGKVRYMAPEQARREALGPFTDVFGIGATLFRMIAGRAPYAAEDDLTTIQALASGAPPLHRLPPDVSPRVVDTILRAIAPAVADRFKTAGQLGDALETLLESEARPDVGRWVNANLSERAIERRSRLGARALGRSEEPGDAPPRIRPRSEPPKVPDLGNTESTSGGPPGFMDVNALIARAREEPARSDPPADEENAGGRSGATSAPPKKPAASTGKAGSSVLGPAAALKLGLLTIVVVVIALALLLFLPSVVRDRAIATAREAGVTMTIERVGVGLGGISLRGIGATVPRTPGITAKAQEIHVGLTGKEARVLGLEVHLEGRRSDLEAGIAALVAD
ncbi:MAG TPA: serine/threonine-protein kinase, partial [Labilithrix sp.]|nr:serine/threonine-protein kinase [Labilithrix sp.]